MSQTYCTVKDEQRSTRFRVFHCDYVRNPKILDVANACNLLRKQTWNEPYQERSVSTFDEFQRLFLEPCKEEDTTIGLAFRGQADQSWKLDSKLYRMYDDCDDRKHLKNRDRELPYLKNRDGQVLQHAKRLLRACEPWPSDDHLWCILRHYGAPTPLLDWTTGLDVALFFAFEEAPANNSPNVAIYMADVGKLLNPTLYCVSGTSDYDKWFNDVGELDAKIADVLLDRTGETTYTVWVFLKAPRFWDIRLNAQEAIFSRQPSSLSLCLEESVKRGMPGALNYATGTLVKVLIPAVERPKAMAYLNERGVTHERIFPDWRGICRNVEGAVRDDICRQMDFLKKLNG